MKLITNSITMLASGTAFTAILAQTDLETTLQEIAEEDETPDPKKFSAIIDMAYHKLENEPDFLPMLENSPTWDPARRSKRKTFFQMMSNYGCHCFPEHKSTVGGRGVPVDELDEACRALYRCHKCVDIEYPGECDTDMGGYKYSLESNGEVNCDIMPRKPDCQMNQCTCDKHFADTVYNLWTNSDGSNWSFNGDYWLSPKYVKNSQKAGNPVFDRDAMCTMGANVTPDACCGNSYPLKQPYNTGSRKCCAEANQTYNEVISKCCAKEGEVKQFSKDCDL